MPTSPPPPPEDDLRRADVAPGSLLVRLGTGVGMSVLAAAIAVIPAMLRMASTLTAAGGPSAPQVWASLVALELVPMLLAVLVLRQARIGLRAFGGPAASARVLGVVAWVLLLFYALTVFGSMLRKNTHHHALAGATFALVGGVLAIVLAIVCARLVAILAARTEKTRRILVAIASVALVGALAFAGMRFARAFTGAAALPPEAGATFIDVLAFAIAALFGSRWAFADRRGLAYGGPAAAVLLLIVGIFSLVGSSVLATTIASQSPGFGVILGVIAGH